MAILGFISITRYRDIDRTFVEIAIIATPTCRTISRMNARLTRALIAGTDRIHSTNAHTHLGQHAVCSTNNAEQR